MIGQHIKLYQFQELFLENPFILIKIICHFLDNIFSLCLPILFIIVSWYTQVYYLYSQTGPPTLLRAIHYRFTVMPQSKLYVYAGIQQRIAASSSSSSSSPSSLFPSSTSSSQPTSSSSSLSPYHHQHRHHHCYCLHYHHHYYHHLQFSKECNGIEQN